jgi:tetratricopeptide (TPR) repeat protein
MLTILGEYEWAVDLYEDVIEERNIPWAHLELDKIRCLQQDYDETIEIFEGLVKENAANVGAYDELAKAYEALEEPIKAQKILNIGAEKSSKSLLRQRKLAEIAYKNDDLETAGSAHKNAIFVEQHSCYKKPDDYNGFAKVLVDTGKSGDALKLVDKLGRDFRDNPNAAMVAAITGVMVHASAGDEGAV